jgi:lipopolysaccharide biosynthesis glycosyltransferase
MSELHVACAADAAYVPHCAAMLHSLCRQHHPARVTVHFLSDDALPAHELERLAAHVRALGAGWHSLCVGAEDRARFPANPRFGQVAWYRVLLPERLPDLERVLYLDADTLVLAPLDELWATPLEGHAVAAVVNPLYPGMRDDFSARLGLPALARYFNSGVLLLNLRHWRTHNLTQAVLDALAQGSWLGDWPDQNLLNRLLWRQCLYLPPRWNAQNTLFDLPARALPFTAAEIREARRNPAILHFIGPYKPWHPLSRHPYRQSYFQHLSCTPWRAGAAVRTSWRQRLLRLLPPRHLIRLALLVQRGREWSRRTWRRIRPLRVSES